MLARVPAVALAPARRRGALVDRIGRMGYAVFQARALSATTSAAAAFNRTMSRKAFFAPSSNSLIA